MFCRCSPGDSIDSTTTPKTGRIAFPGEITPPQKEPSLLFPITPPKRDKGISPRAHSWASWKRARLKKEVLRATLRRLFSVIPAKNLALPKLSLPMVAQDREGRWFVASKVSGGGARPVRV